MIETVQTKEGIDEQGFRYYARMEGYTNHEFGYEGVICPLRAGTY